MGRAPWRAGVGLGLILLGAIGYGAIDRWMRTRIVYPVHMPISLAAGHIHSGPFRLNLSAEYWVEVSSGEGWHPELKCTYRYPRTQTRWVLYKEGKIFDRSDEPTFVDWPTSFDAGPGVYDLDVEVLWDTSCMDPAHPSLRVFARSENYETGVLGVKAVCCAGIGLGFVLLTFLPAVQRVYSRESAIIPVTGSAVSGGGILWPRTLPLRRKFSGLPPFGLYAALLYGTFAVLIILLTAVMQPPPPMGWWVRVLKPGESPAKPDRWNEPLMVSVRFTGNDREPDLFLNDKAVAWTDLERVLREKLSSRRDWVVYVGGDDLLPFAEVARVIDTARGLRARVVLVPNRSR